MKLTCQYRRKNALLYTFTVITAFIGAQSMPAMALTYNDGNSTNYLGWPTNDFRLKVGVDEPGNVLYITNGGIASVTEVYVGETTLSTDNLLSVTNGGLLFAGNVDTNNVSTGGVYVGDANGDGKVVVNNASELDTDYLYLGKGENESGQGRAHDGRVPHPVHLDIT